MPQTGAERQAAYVARRRGPVTVNRASAHNDEEYNNGTPTAFLTLSANETRWPHLLSTLHRLSDEYKFLGDEIPQDEIFEKLDSYVRNLAPATRAKLFKDLPVIYQ